MTTLNEYQEQAGGTAIYPSRGQKNTEAINYCLVGMGGEAGEVLNKWKKVLRGDRDKSPFKVETRLGFGKELGGVLWYLSQAAAELGFSLEDIAQINLEELSLRKQRGTLQGDGDNR